MSNKNWIAVAFSTACLVSVPVRAQDVPSAAPAESNAVSLAYMVGLPVGDTGVAMTEKAVINYGTVSKGQSLLSVPFTYAHVVRVKQDIVGMRRLGPLSKQVTVLQKDEVGFEANPARFSSGVVSDKIFCFFYRHAYSQPTCYATLPQPGGVLIYFASTLSNLPRDYSSGDITGAFVQTDSLETLFSFDEPDITEHHFQLDMVVKKWNDKGVTIVWRSDGMDVLPPEEALPFGQDGVARIRLPIGLVTIKPEGGALIVTQAKSGQAAN